MGLYFPRGGGRGDRERESARGRQGLEYRGRVWTQTALLTSTPKEMEDERQKDVEKGKRKWNESH